jgi:HEAT repeat protein
MPVPRGSLIVVPLVLAVGAIVAAWGLYRHNSLAAFRDPNPAVRVAAIRALGWHGDPHVLIPALRDENADVRLLAAQLLGGPGPEGKPRAEALVEAFDDPHVGVRREALESLCRVGPESGPVLCRALTDPRPRVRAGAARALIGAGCWKEERDRAPDEIETALPLLRKLLADEDADVRRCAERALTVLSRTEGAEGPPGDPLPGGRP